MYTYPGVYVEELPGGARPIAGVATSDAAFVDWFPRGRMNVATRVTSWPDFERTFGGLDVSSTASWHIRQFFLNGGGRAWIVRIGFGNLTAAAIQTTAPAQQTLAVSAINPGAQGNEIRFAVLHDNANNGTTFELLVRRYAAGVIALEERHSNLSISSADANFADTVVNTGGTASALVRVQATNGVRPARIGAPGDNPAEADMTPLTGGADPAGTASVNLQNAGQPALALTAASPGSWGRRLYAAVAHDAALNGTTYDLILREYDGSRLVAGEAYSGLSIVQGNPRFAATIINRDSQFVTATQANGVRPEAQIAPAGVGTLAQADMTQFTGGGDGALPGTAAWDAGAQAAFTDVNDATLGLEALNRIEPEVFNILCLPAAAELPQPAAAAVYADAYRLCRDRRAVLLADIAEAGNRRDLVIGWLAARGLSNLENAAVFFPRVEVANPLTGDTLRISSSGTVAGIMARIDGSRGVWKASAGVEAGLRGATPTRSLTDLQNGELNVQGINAIRSLPVYGSVVWGARTLAGADAAASEWKYFPVRRLALFLEESLRQGLAWVVFEPNDEPLWGQIRLNVESFMQGLFLRGAFQGTSPRQAYYVLCDRSNNPQSDVNLGIVNIEIGFAPLRPAEFVVLKFRQIAGQSQS
jgi:phage tail sheath protein FI